VILNQLLNYFSLKRLLSADKNNLRAVLNEGQITSCNGVVRHWILSWPVGVRVIEVFHRLSISYCTNDEDAIISSCNADHLSTEFVPLLSHHASVMQAIDTAFVERR
jgi:hypothetical protein